MLHRKGCEMRVRGQVAGLSRLLKKAEQDVNMTVSRVDERRLRTGEPGPDAGARTAHFEGIIGNLRIGSDADEAQNRHSGKTNRAGPVHQVFPPTPCRLVLAAPGIVGMHQ